jgi:succinyl-diaminopimelate desuccinylase
VSPSDFIDRNQQLLVTRLQRLVRTETPNPPGENYDAVTRYLARELEALGLKVRRYSIPKAILRRSLPPDQQVFPRFNVLGKLAVPGATETVHFNAHYDVVPVSGGWRHGTPFSGAVEGGWIYGRGTADMKGSIASLLLALQALRATRTAPRLNLEVSFTADEETDSLLGTGWLVQNAPIRPDYAIVMEGGEKASICCGHNGVVWLEVAVHGRAAHGSKPEDGINAFEKMAALARALADYQRLIAVRHTFATPDGKLRRATANVGGVFTGGPGGKINTVPGYAAFTIDRRVLPGEDHARAEQDLRAFLAAAARKIPQCRITVSKVSENFSCFHSPRHPFFAAMATSVRRVRRAPTAFSVSTGFNDMYFFAGQLGIPTLGYGPGGEKEHSVDERAALRDLRDTARIYADLLTTFAGTG